jgi:hypothetical protein
MFQDDILIPLTSKLYNNGSKYSRRPDTNSSFRDKKQEFSGFPDKTYGIPEFLATQYAHFKNYNIQVP